MGHPTITIRTLADAKTAMATQLMALILLYLSTATTAETAPVKEIKICTAAWAFVSDENGTGLYHDLWRAIFEPAGISINVSYAPYKRCRATIKQQVHDVYPGGYEEPGVLVPKWHLGTELLTVARRKTNDEQWQGQATLKDRSVAWERGYDFDTYNIVTVPVHLQEFNQLSYGLMMLASGRIDFVLDYYAHMKETIKKEKLGDELVLLPNVITGPKYFMVFNETERSRTLIKIWDEGMQRLHKSGELQAIYKTYEDLTY